MSKVIDINSLGLQRLNSNLPTPLYHQLYENLRGVIQSGLLPIGAKVPGESDLSETMNVSRITAKRALNELAKSGLVTRERGRGTIVTANTDLNFRGGANDYVQNVNKLRQKTQADILSRQKIEAPEDVASRLRIQTGSIVEKIIHRLSLRDNILSYVITYVPDDLLRGFDEDDLRREPVMTLLVKSGVSVQRADQKIFAVSANEQDCDILGTEMGQALLKIQCVIFDKTDRPVEDIHAWYHPEHYQYQMTLTNLDSSGIDT